MVQRWWQRARPAPRPRFPAAPGRAAFRFRRVSALERQRLEAVDILLRGGLPRGQARLLVCEIFRSPATVALHACLPTPVVVQRSADRIRRSGIKARAALAVAEFLHRPDRRIMGAGLKHADSPPEPPAEGFVGEACPTRRPD